MPTGYTEQIYEGKEVSFPQFALRCARAFGALVEMRDQALDAAIPDAFAARTWHRDEHEKAVDRLTQALSWTTQEAADEALHDFEAAADRVAESNAKSHTRWERYQRMLNEVYRWNPPSKDHEELKKFMIKQLTESMDHDCYIMELPVRLSGPAYRERAIQQAQKDIAFHRKYDEEEASRAKERAKWVHMLKESLTEHSVEVVT